MLNNVEQQNPAMAMFYHEKRVDFLAKVWILAENPCGFAGILLAALAWILYPAEDELPWGLGGDT